MPDKMSVPTVQFTPEFKRNLRTLAKKYRHIRDDVAPIIAQLQDGHLPGKQVTGIGYTVFKVRMPNRDRAKGKSGGYRIIYSEIAQIGGGKTAPVLLGQPRGKMVYSMRLDPDNYLKSSSFSTTSRY